MSFQHFNFVYKHNFSFTSFLISITLKKDFSWGAPTYVAWILTGSWGANRTEQVFEVEKILQY